MPIFSRGSKVAPNIAIQTKNASRRVNPPSVAASWVKSKINKSIQRVANPIVVTAQNRMLNLSAKESRYRKEYDFMKSQKDPGPLKSYSNFLEEKYQTNQQTASDKFGNSYSGALSSKKRRKTRNKSTKRKKQTRRH